MYYMALSNSVKVKAKITFPESDKESSTVNLSFDSETKIADLYGRVRSKLDILDECDAVIQLDHPQLLVINGRSSYDPESHQGLCISADQTLAEYFRQYRAFHGFLPAKDISKSTICMKNHTRYDENAEDQIVEYEESTVNLGPACLKFHRTLRVPDNAKNYILPHGLGTFPLQPAAKFSKYLPDPIKSRGGFLMPMFQREALWIDFSGSSHCAIKISVGGINAITGQPQDEAPPSNEIQDYVVAPRQRWFDGIRTASGVVRQLLAMPLSHGHTIKQQITAEAIQGGIRIDIYPLLDSAAEFRDESGTCRDISMSPHELGVVEGKRINMKLKSIPCVSLGDYMKHVDPEPVIQVIHRKCGLYIQTLTGKRIMLRAWPSLTIGEIKTKIEYSEGIHPSFQLLAFAGKQLEDGRSLSYYNIAPIDSTLYLLHRPRGCAPLEEPRMGLVAGGCIMQEIYKDTRAVNLYDTEAAERLFIYPLSTTGWERITGVIPPMTPIVPGTYKRYDYPWFDLYDEQIPDVTSTSHSKNVQSAHQLDNSGLPPYSAKPAAQMLNPEAPPPCSTHGDATAYCVLRPCDHFVCVGCFGQTIMNGSKCSVPNCDRMAEMFVGFKKPIMEVNAGGRSMGNWWAVEDQIDGAAFGETDANVVTVLLDEDRVSCLYGKYK